MRALPTRPLLAVLAAVLAVTGLPACGGGGGGYTLTASFPRAVALYEESSVKVMGVDVGTVTDVEVQGDHIAVTMSIDDDVPLPDDVGAAIAPLTLIGERNIVLFPPWREGQRRAGDGDHIPEGRTRIPVEPDEALEAFNDLAEAIDPDAVNRLVTSGAANVEGQGASLNEAIGDISGLTGALAAQDEKLLEAAENLHDLAATLNTRSGQLGDVIDSFALVTGALADEREGLTRLLDGVVRLSDAGQRLLGAYEGTLPGDLATLAQLALTLSANSSSLEQIVDAFPRVAQAQIASFDPTAGARGALVLNVNIPQTATAGLEPLFDLLGLPVPCVPVLGQACDGTVP
jgi:phospholipid/cholesterol/gamma-HCH transport system substrate-binding protein